MQKETNGEKYSQPLIVGMPLLLLISYIPRSAGIKVNGSLQNNMLDEMICCIINVLAVITSYKHIHLHVIQSLLTIYKHGRPQGTHKIRLPLHVYHLQLHILMKKKNNIYQHNLHAVSLSTNWWDTFRTIIILDSVIYTHTQNKAKYLATALQLRLPSEAALGYLCVTQVLGISTRKSPGSKGVGIQSPTRDFTHYAR